MCVCVCVCGCCSNGVTRTIEDELFKAFVGAGTVSELNSANQKKVQLMRAARTDKGVHALGQVVSLKLIVTRNLVERVNKLLPTDIKVFGLIPFLLHLERTNSSLIEI